MARFRADDAEHYGGQGGGGFFTLRDDKDTAQVRFMYESVDDVEGLSVHVIKEDGDDGKEKKHYVNCLRQYNDPIDKCPFCAAQKPVQAKLFVPIYDIESGTTKTWERGKKFFSKMSSICSRYPNLVSHIFTIERNGKAGDQTTSYEIFEDEQDDTKLEDLPEAPSLSGLVWDKSAEDMEYYLEEGEFPPTDDDEDERPRRRDSRRNDRERDKDTSRRTPSNDRRRNRDRDVY